MSKHTQIKLLIVDDHPALRKGLREVEEIHSQITVVGEAGNGAEALRQTSSLRPTVVLLDYRSPMSPVTKSVAGSRKSIHQFMFYSSPLTRPSQPSAPRLPQGRPAICSRRMTRRRLWMRF